ncbi:trypsin-like peptidase domain-containing protein [Rahnella sp. SAP-1]|uniref:Trypsin-like peptidase domain-containing protein n=1 Tax=Rouxiella aceris TaxID=2703884 RepID=A0A848MN80_9GAMM|nr:trypsin-like peptidase domain-containing protein [Rouxiella aceris]NMP28531.1 trypsin-like peptidase domain-containing protein [Rouxiella aceris]
MSEDIGSLRASLVQVRSTLTGSGVWVNLGVNDHSYVFTAKHNIDADCIEVYNFKGEKLDANYIGPLGELDISIIKINSRCDNTIKLSLDKSSDLGTDSKCWILGYPKALLKTSDNKDICHSGTILIDHGDIFFRIDENLPHDFDRDHIDGFSGGPILEVNNGSIYLKGIITNSYDNNFSYPRIKGVKLFDIYDALPETIKDEMDCEDYVQNLIEPSIEALQGHIGNYLLDGDFSTKLRRIDLNVLLSCKYFYLPDDMPKLTQHNALLRNNESITSYLHSRILSMIIDEEITNISMNPTFFEGEKVFTIHTTNFTEKSTLIAKLITQDISLEYANAKILIISPNDSDDLSFVQRDRIYKVIANYAEGKEPELYSENFPFNRKKILRDFLETRKKEGVKFSILNIKFLMKMIIDHIDNRLYGEKYDKDLLKQEIAKVLRLYE